MGLLSDLGLGFLDGGSSSASVTSTVNLNLQGLDNIQETIKLDGATTINQHVTLDPTTVTLNENIDLKPLTINDNIDLKPVTFNENIDLKPVAVDSCQTFRLAPLPDTNVCQPYRHHVSYTLFGMELWAATYDGESNQRILSPHQQHVVAGGPDTYGQRHPPTAATGRGIRVRILDDER